MKKDAVKILGQKKSAFAHVALVEIGDMNLNNYAAVVPYLTDGAEGLEEVLEWFGIFGVDYRMIAHCHWSRGNKRKLSQMGMTAYYPFLIQYKDKTRMWAIALPNAVNRHELIGTHLGYPKCCIDEYITDLKQCVSDTDNPLAEKRDHVNYHLPEKTKGEVPCWRCITEILPDDRLAETRKIAMSGHCRADLEKADPDDFRVFFDAVDTYLGHLHRSWSPFDKKDEEVTR
jgi:hypothetical protein